MKLEEILPEIRKGRGCRYDGGLWNRTGDLTIYSSGQLFGDKWELEPEGINLGAGAVAQLRASDKNCDDPRFVITDRGTQVVLLSSEIDRLKAAADKARGREYVPVTNTESTHLWVKYRDNCSNPIASGFSGGFYEGVRVGHRAGWEQATQQPAPEQA